MKDANNRAIKQGFYVVSGEGSYHVKRFGSQWGVCSSHPAARKYFPIYEKLASAMVRIEDPHDLFSLMVEADPKVLRGRGKIPVYESLISKEKRKIRTKLT